MKNLTSSFFTCLCVGALVTSVSGCAKTRDVLGMTNKAPDEFAVVDHPPLSVPPEFALRPPIPGAPSPIAESPSAKAAKALYGDSNMELVQQKGVSSLAAQKISGAEAGLLQQAGVTNANPAIRGTLEAEANANNQTNRKLLSDLLFWKKEKPTGTVIDARSEAARLNAAKASGQPVTVTPSIAYDTGKEVQVK